MREGRERKRKRARERVGSHRAKSLYCPSFFVSFFAIIFLQIVFGFCFLPTCLLQSAKNKRHSYTQRIRGQINKQHTDCLHFLMRQRRALTRCPFVASQAPCTHTDTDAHRHSGKHSTARAEATNPTEATNLIERSKGCQKLKRTAPPKSCAQRERERLREQISESA